VKVNRKRSCLLPGKHNVYVLSIDGEIYVEEIYVMHMEERKRGRDWTVNDGTYRAVDCTSRPPHHRGKSPYVS